MSDDENPIAFTQLGIPTHQELVVPAIQAVIDLGGSAKAREITDHVLEHLPNAEELAEMTYPNRPGVSVLADRIAWGRSTAKLIGALDRPSRGMYLTTDLGEELATLPTDTALEQIRELDLEYSRQQRQKKASKAQKTAVAPQDENNPSAEVLADSDAEEEGSAGDWKGQLLDRLHRLTPEGFEKFVLYLLRRYGLELTHIGGSGDEGIDGIGTAPLSPVLSSRVAVQVKRYAPNGNSIGRETVALFQRDAQTKGAERAILVTLSRFTEPARKAATSATPTVDLISGDRLAELIRDDGDSGVKMQPTVNEAWFDIFD